MGHEIYADVEYEVEYEDFGGLIARFVLWIPKLLRDVLVPSVDGASLVTAARALGLRGLHGLSCFELCASISASCDGWARGVVPCSPC